MSDYPPINQFIAMLEDEEISGTCSRCAFVQEAKAALAAAQHEIELLKQMLDNAEKHGKEAHERAEKAEANTVFDGETYFCDHSCKLLFSVRQELEALKAADRNC